MSNTPTDAEIDEVTLDVLGYAALDKETNDTARMIARAVLAKWGTPASVVVGEVAEHYRNAIASACEGWTMPDGLRKHLETALWSPPTPQPTQPQAGVVPLSDAQIAEMMRDTWGCASIAPRYALEFARAVERAHGITQKGGS